MKIKRNQQIAIIFAIYILTAIQAADDVEDDKVQQAIKSYQKQIDGGILEFEWCGTNEIYNDETNRVVVDQEVEDSFDTRIFVLTDEGQVFKSTNYGKSWVHVTKAFSNSNNQPFFSTEVSVSPVDGKAVYVWGHKDTSYFSEECGRTWKKLTHPVGLFDFRFHRKNKNWILAFTTIECKRFDEDCDSNMRNIFVSQDAGVTFTFLATKVLEASWNRMNNFYNVDSPGILMAIQQETQSNVVYTEDFGQTMHTVQEGGDNFFQAEYFLFLTVKPKTNKRTYDMKIATMFDDFNYYVEPKSLKLPFENTDQLSFTILKSDGAMVFLAIHHETQNMWQSNIYVSDWRGYDLTLALLYNVRAPNGDCDFEKIQSNEGVYIANTYDVERVEKLRNEIKKMDINTTKNKSQTKDKKNLHKELPNYRKSVISFDSGSSWHPIRAPSQRWNGKTVVCSGECSLHLAGRTYYKKSQMYSSSNAPGLIVALGSIGTHLENNFNLLNTYLSNDGGHQWREILKGPHIFEIGDHGGIIVAASAANKTNIIKYSWDEGKTWSEYKMSTLPFEIDQIITEPSNMEQRFVIYGKGRNGTETSMIVSIDLQELHIRGCVGAEHPNRPNSDYEIWIPTNFKGDKCIFGRKVKYVRRKPDAKCFNAITTDQKTVIEECPCTQEDWECDFGFYRKENELECIPMNDHYSPDNLAKPPADCSWSYIVSKGYRKIPGVFCQGGIDLSPEYKECPPKITVPRIEQETEQYKSFKEAQKEIISQYQQQQQQQSISQNGKSDQSSSLNLGAIFTQIFYVGLVLVALSLSFIFRENIKQIVKSIGEVGHNKERRQYQQLQPSQNKESYSQQKNTENVRIQETEERNYDLEEQDMHYQEDEKPVLQRDQEDYYYQDDYD
ncbi:hypothetical protein ABPG72_014104 [Tetrahymena utriculariae]